MISLEDYMKTLPIEVQKKVLERAEELKREEKDLRDLTVSENGH